LALVTGVCCAIAELLMVIAAIKMHKSDVQYFIKLVL